MDTKLIDKLIHDVREELQDVIDRVNELSAIKGSDWDWLEACEREVELKRELDYLESL